MKVSSVHQLQNLLQKNTHDSLLSWFTLALFVEGSCRSASLSAPSSLGSHSSNPLKFARLADPFEAQGSFCMKLMAWHINTLLLFICSVYNIEITQKTDHKPSLRFPGVAVTGITGLPLKLPA